jgi:subfamily B ATP-binding cassette protein MsbA
MFGEYRRLVGFLRPHIGIFVLAVICMAISAAFDGLSLGMIVPLADKVLADKDIVINTVKLPAPLFNLINRINAMSPLRLLNIIAVSVLVLFVLKGVFIFLRSYLMSCVSQRVIRDIRDQVYAKFQTLSLDYYASRRVGEMVSRITYDVSVIQNSITEGLTDLFYYSFQVILFTGIIFFIHWRLSIISLMLFPLIAIPIARMGRILRKISTRTQEKIADINSLLYETLSGARIVKGFCREDYEIDRFKKQNQDLYRLSMKTVKRNLVLSPLTEFIGALGAVAVFVLGGREVIKGVLSFGVFGLFLASLLSLVRPFKRLARVYTINQQALAAARRIFDVLDTSSNVMEKPGAGPLAPIRESILFEDVCFRYGSQEVLRNINLEVKAGEVIAIVGPSGVGKTTLVNLIPRFYDPTSGVIRIDGKDIRDVTLKSLRSQIGIVTQDTILFNDTVKANIIYGKLDAKDEEVRRAAIAANADFFISRFPKGYETVIGDRGFVLSGGEKQRIAIARAVLKDPPILILDEATSQLDVESEAMVRTALERLMAGRTVFVIAHRLSTVRRADKIVLLDKGSIVQVGRHEELLSRDGFYRRLYQMQFRDLD